MKPLVKIAEEYYKNGLDGEARKRWGLDDQHKNFTPPKEIELYQGRGGKRLLTLADCFVAQKALSSPQKPQENPKCNVCADEKEINVTETDIRPCPRCNKPDPISAATMKVMDAVGTWNNEIADSGLLELMDLKSQLGKIYVEYQALLSLQYPSTPASDDAGNRDITS